MFSQEIDKRGQIDMSIMIRLVLLSLVLVGCVSSATMDQQFYDGIEQSSVGFGENVRELAGFIGLYEGSEKFFYNTEWQDSILAASREVLGKTRKMYSIVDTYCPRGEAPLCDDLELLYTIARTLHGNLDFAINANSTSRMDLVISDIDDLIAHLEGLSEY